ncbi:hypothetical protein Anas_08321, partial [Armadillidium nasatum]
NFLQIHSSESQRDNWTPIGGQGVESLPQKSPLKVTIKKALETSEDNPFKAPSSTPVKKHLRKENHLLLVGNIKPDSTIKNDHKERLILKSDEDESVKSVSSSLESELEQTKEELSFYKTQSQVQEKKVSYFWFIFLSLEILIILHPLLTLNLFIVAEDLEKNLKMVQSELDCQRENLERSKMRLEDKLKEKQKEHIEERARFEAELSTLEQEIRDLKRKIEQQETLSLCNENAMQGCLDKIKSQLLSAEKEKALAQSQCGQLETSLVKLGKSEEELTKLCSQLKQERDMVKAQAENLKFKLNDAESLQNRLQSQLESSEVSVAALKSSIEETLADHKAALNKERETCNLEIDRITKEKEKNLKAKDDLILTLKEEKKNVKESLEELLKKKEEAEKKRRKVEEDCKTKLSGVESLEQRINDLEKSLNEKEKIISEGKAQLEDKMNAAEKEARQKICAVEEVLEEQSLNIVSKDAEIEARNEKLQKATDTISSLVSTLNVAKEKLSTYESMKTDYEEKVQDLNKRIKSEGAKVSALEKHLSETEALLSSSEESLQVKMNEVENLKNKVSSLTADVTLYVKENKCKDSQIWELNNYIKTVNKDKAELDASVEKLRDEREIEADRHRKEVEGYMNTISDMEKNLQEGVNNLFENEKCLENLQEQNDILCKTLSVSNNEISEMNSSIEALNQMVETLKKEKEIIESDNAKIKEDLFNAERERNVVKNKLSETEKRYFEELSISLKQGNDLKEKEKLVNKLSQDIEMKNENMKELELKISQLETIRVNLQNSVTKYEEQINNLKTKGSDEGESEIAVASTTEDGKAKRDQRDKEMEELTLELICKNDQLETEVQILKNENCSLIQVRESNQNKLESYMSENIFLEKETKELKLENLNLLSEIRELNMISKELEEERKSAINANKKLIGENSDLISQRDYLEEKVKILEAGKELQEIFKDEHCLVILESLKASYYDLHSKDNDDGFELWLKENLCKTEEKFEEIKECKSCNAQLTKEIELLKTKLEDMKRDVDLKTIELENLKDESYSMKDKIGKIEKERNDSLMAQNEYLSLKVSLENECETLKSKIVEFDVKLLNSESEKKDLLEKYSALMNLNEGYEEKYSHLQNKINSLMSEIAVLKELSEEKTNEIERLGLEKETLIREKVDCKRLEKTIENLKTLENTYMQRNLDLQNRVGELIESESILQENLQRTESKRLTLVTQINSLNNDVQNLKLEKEVLKKEKEFVIDENVSLNVLKTELLNKVEMLEKEIRKENEKNMTLREQCKDMDNTKRSLEDLSVKNRSFENLLKEKEKEILEMEEKSKNLETNFKTLEQKFDSVKDKVRESKKVIDVLLREKENILLEKNSLCEEVEESQKALQDELEKEKNISFNFLSKCNEFEVNLKVKETELRAARESLDQIKEELEKQRQSHDIQVTQLHEKVEECSKDKMNIEKILLEKDWKMREYEKNIDEYEKNLKESQNALKKSTSELTRSELKLREMQELLDAKSLKYEQLNVLHSQMSVEKDNMLKTINNLRDKASELEVQKRNLEKKFSKRGSGRKAFFSRESTSQSGSSSSSSVIGLSQTPLMGISKAVTTKAAPISMAGKRRGRRRRSGRRSIAREYKNSSVEEQKEAAYDKFQSIVNSAEQEAMKKESLSRRLTRSSLSLSQDSVKRFHSTTISNSSVEENKPKKLKLSLNHEGLSTKLCQGLNDILMGEDSPGVLTRQTTPLKIKDKTENKDNRRPLKSLDVNNDAGRMPSSPKEESHNDEVSATSTDDGHLEAAIQRDSLCNRRSSLYPREGSRKGSKDCNPQ